MKLTFAYLGRSRMIEPSPGGERVLSLAPNLTRERVSFNAPLLEPLEFREAISALHDVVINDLRYKPRDRTAYEEWKKQQAVARQAQYRHELDLAKKALQERHGDQPVPSAVGIDRQRALQRGSQRIDGSSL